MNFRVRLSPQSIGTVTAEYTVTGGTAEEGTDYEAASSSGTVTFAPEELQNTISVPLIDDGEREPNETFTVTLSNPQNATLAQSSATGTVRDNDQPPPPPLVENQVTDDIQPTQVKQQPTEETQEPDERPHTTRSGEEGGGGCMIASNEGTNHAESTLLALLLLGFSALSALRLKNRA